MIERGGMGKLLIEFPLIHAGGAGSFVTAGYWLSYGTVLQTDVRCEICRALFFAYPPPK